MGLPFYRNNGDELWLNGLVTPLGLEQLAIASGRDLREAYTLGWLRGTQEAVILPVTRAKFMAAGTETFGMTVNEARAVVATGIDCRDYDSGPAVGVESDDGSATAIGLGGAASRQLDCGGVGARSQDRDRAVDALSGRIKTSGDGAGAG